VTPQAAAAAAPFYPGKRTSSSYSRPHLVSPSTSCGRAQHTQTHVTL